MGIVLRVTLVLTRAIEISSLYINGTDTLRTLTATNSSSGFDT